MLTNSTCGVSSDASSRGRVALRVTVASVPAIRAVAVRARLDRGRGLTAQLLSCGEASRIEPERQNEGGCTHGDWRCCPSDPLCVKPASVKDDILLCQQHQLYHQRSQITLACVVSGLVQFGDYDVPGGSPGSEVLLNVSPIAYMSLARNRTITSSEAGLGSRLNQPFDRHQPFEKAREPVRVIPIRSERPALYRRGFF